MKKTENNLWKICRVYPLFQDDLWYSEHYIAKELNKDGIRTTFVTSDKYRKSWSKYIKRYYPHGYYKFDYYEVFRLKAFFPSEQVIFTNLFKLYKLLFSKNNTHIHIYGFGSISTLQIFFLTLFAPKNHPAILFSDHSNTITHTREGVLVDLYFKVLGIILNLFNNRYQYIITFSEVGKQVISRKLNVPHNKFRIIPLGYDQDTFFFRPECKNTESKMLVGFAGKISASKRIDFLIVRLSKKEFVDKVKLAVVGMVENPYCDYIRKLVIETKLETEFMPFADRESLAYFYNYIDLAVFPGAISITTIEANGCGTPVLIYESIEGLSERVADGRGMLFKTADEFDEQMRSFIRIYDTRSINNRHIAESTIKKSSWQVIKDQYKEIYAECVKNTNSK